MFVDFVHTTFVSFKKCTKMEVGKTKTWVLYLGYFNDFHLGLTQNQTKDLIIYYTAGNILSLLLHYFPPPYVLNIGVYKKISRNVIGLTDKSQELSLQYMVAFAIAFELSTVCTGDAKQNT